MLEFIFFVILSFSYEDSVFVSLKLIMMVTQRNVFRAKEKYKLIKQNIVLTYTVLGNLTSNTQSRKVISPNVSTSKALGKNVKTGASRNVSLCLNFTPCTKTFFSVLVMIVEYTLLL